MTIKGRRKIFIKKKLFESQKKENLVIMQAQTITKQKKKKKRGRTSFEFNIPTYFSQGKFFFNYLKY